MDKSNRIGISYEETVGGKTFFTRKEILLGELMDMEDIDLKKFIYIKSSGTHYSEVSMRKVDNEQKIGYYRFQDKLCMNKNGKFYMRSQLLEYIVYDKATKKVKLSKGSNATVYQQLLTDYFSTDELIHELKIKPTATLCKKIIEGSISTISDFVKYLRSYVLKKKDVPLDVVYKFVMMKVPYLLEVVEDPESIMSVEDLIVDVDFNITNLGLFKCKLSEVKNLNERYDEWCKEQMSKFLRLGRSGDVPIGVSTLF